MRRVWPVLLVLLGAPASSQEEEDPVAFAIDGAVTDGGAEPRPAAGVLVQAWDALAPSRFLGQAETGPRGRFRLDFRHSSVGRRDHPFGPVILSAGGPGLSVSRARVPAGARDVAMRVRVVTRGLRGRVLDANGRPLPAAVVRARPADWDRPAPPPIVRDDGGPEVWEETTTDEEGRFRLRRFSGDGGLRIEIIADTLFHRTVAGDLIGHEPIEHELRVPAGRRVAGVVRGVAGAELLDARHEVVGVTDDGGRYDVVVSGEPELVVHAPGFVVATTRGGELDLAKLPPVRGRVVDDDDRPVAGCRVTLAPRLGPELVAWTDERGRYAFEVATTGIVPIRAERSGYVPTEVRAETPAELTLRLHRGARVLGVVVRDGAPALGVRVSAVVPGDGRAPPWLPGRGREAAFAYTDARGRFDLRAAPDDATRVFAWEEGRRSASARVGTEALRLALKATRPLRGIVRNDTGAPLADARVECRWDRDAFTTRSDRNGRFAFEALPVQPYWVTVAAPGHLDLRELEWPGETVQYVCGSNRGDGVLRVVVSTDRADRDVEIVLRGRGAPPIARRARGALADFGGLAPGTYDVIVRAEGHLDETRAVEVAGPTTVTIEPRRGGSLRLLATPGAAVAIQRLEGKPPPVAVLERAQASQELRGFGPGRYRFLARAPGELIAIREVALGPRTPPVELDLRGGKAATLTVSVRDPAGQPMDGAEIVLVTEGGFRWNTRQQTGSDGRVVLKRLIRGRLEVNAERGNRAGGALVDVAPGAALELAIEIR